MGSISFTSVGDHTWSPDPGVSQVTITLEGAPSNGVGGGRLTGTLAVVDSAVYHLVVGGIGNAPTGNGGGGSPLGGGGQGGTARGTGQLGGYSGGGACYIMSALGASSGVLCTAGGAGGSSGDGAAGGAGGGSTGASGATAGGPNVNVTDATGGTQSAGGNGANNTLATTTNGQAGSGPEFETSGGSYSGSGGIGGSLTLAGQNGPGGGGGGGGWYGGGGGNAGIGTTPGSSGAGGSSYVGSLTNVTENSQGTGSLTTGSIVITWVDPVIPVPMAAKATLSATVAITKFGSIAMGGSGALTVSPSLEGFGVVAMGATASVGVAPSFTHPYPISFSAAAAMAPTASITRTGQPVAMGASAALAIDGTQELPYALAISVAGSIRFAQAQGDVHMSATAGMTILRGPSTIPASQPMHAAASLSITPTHDVLGSIAIGTQSALGITPTVIHSRGLQIVAKASVTDSPTLTHLGTVTMGGQAVLFVYGFMSLSKSAPITSQSSMIVIPSINRTAPLPINASAALGIVNAIVTQISVVPFAAQAGLSISPSFTVNASSAMRAQAVLDILTQRSVIPGPYLVTLDSLGDTISFTADSEPNPRTVTNTLTITNTGEVTP